MSESAHGHNRPLTEKTFTSYTKEQSKYYAQHRRPYHPSVYAAVINQHTSTGGQNEFLLDVGCGPGTAIAALAPQFSHAMGLDPSESMVYTARSLGGVTSTSEPIQFEVSTAEDLGGSLATPIQDSSVDLLISANAAHWFDLSRFWPAAARVVKPGGSVALWTSGHIQIHPSVPNADAIQAAMERVQKKYLSPHYAAGNLLTRGRYLDLPLPWTLANPVLEFDKDTFFRKEWGVTDDFILGQQDANLDMFERMMGTMSPVTRWREANPGAVGTEQDVARILRREIEVLLREAGVEEGKEMVRGVVQGVVLVVKKRV